jgi:hypothetical protein
MLPFFVKVPFQNMVTLGSFFKVGNFFFQKLHYFYQQKLHGLYHTSGAAIYN